MSEQGRRGEKGRETEMNAGEQEQGAAAAQADVLGWIPGQKIASQTSVFITSVFRFPLSSC